MSNNQTVIAHADLYLKNLFVNITEYPVRAQGTTSGVQYSVVASSGVAGVSGQAEILLYKSETNYPNTVGFLNYVYYEISFELKTENTTATLTWKLEAKNKGGSWVRMCADQSATNITTWTEKTIKGYLHIQSGITKVPFEIRLVLQSDESDVNKVISCTWATAGTALGAGYHVESLGKFNARLYAGAGSKIFYNTGDDSWVQTTISGVSAIYEFAELGGAFYCATDNKIRKLNVNTWDSMGNSPVDCRSLCKMGSKLYAGLVNSDVEESSNGTTWTSTGLSGDGATGEIHCLINFGGVLYAGTDTGEVWKYVVASTEWQRIAPGLTENIIHCFGILSDGTDDYLYVGTEDDCKVLRLNKAGNAWTNTGTLASATRVHGLFVYGSTFYAGTSTLGDVFIFDGASPGTWTNTSDLSGVYVVYGFADFSNRLYCGTSQNGQMYKATITEKSGEGHGRVKNDTVINIVGRIV